MKPDWALYSTRSTGEESYSVIVAPPKMMNIWQSNMSTIGRLCFATSVSPLLVCHHS